MNFSRKTILVVGAALLAACGDKVTVSEYTPPATVAKVNSVEVAPATATLNIKDKITLTAAVNADAGIATTVTWNSSDATKATVSSAGLVEALAATPGVAICATSTVDAGKKGCASIVVTPATSVIPASVSIASITAAGNLNAPVNPAAVALQMDVRLNVNPGNQTISKIVLIVGTTRADSQMFTAAQAAALRFAADEAIAAQATFPQVIFSVNTAALKADGSPRWLNGSQGVSAQLYTTQGGTTTASTATAKTDLTFANVDTYTATVATSGTTANALSATGFRYDKGGLDVTVTPAIYSGRTIASATLFFGSACDANLTGARNTALTAPATGSTAWTKIGWANSTPTTGGALIGNYLTNYEFSAALCPGLNATGETIAVTAVDANGDAVLNAAAPANVSAANSLRLDNRAPNGGALLTSAPFFNANPNGRQNGWINGSVSLVGVRATHSTTSNSWLENLAGYVDAGQGTYTPFLRIAASATGTVDEARAATPSSAPTLPAPSAAGNTYCAIVTVQDALGNESNRPGAGTACGAVQVGSATSTAVTSQLFGVDIAAPVITAGTSTDNATYLDANERRGALPTMTNNFAVSVVDTGLVGNSGMLTPNAVMGTVTLRNDANTALTAAAKCVAGAYTAADGCVNAPMHAAPVGVLPWVPVAPAAANTFGAVGATVITGATTPGYYTYVAYARDAAGNTSGTITKTVGFDVVGNIPALTTALYNTPLSGGQVVFNANASDNFDLRDVSYMLYYGAAFTGIPLVYPAVAINSFNGTQLFSNVSAGYTVPNFIRQIEEITAQPAGIVLAAAQKPTALWGQVRDQSNQKSAWAVTAIPGANVTTGSSYILPALQAAQQVRSFAITNAATLISDGQGLVAPVNPTSVTLVADVYGPTATFNTPFARVEFYASVLGSMVQLGSSTAYTTVDDGSAYGRRHRYTFSWTPGSLYAPGATALYAIGVNSVGDALATPASAAITITNP